MRKNGSRPSFPPRVTVPPTSAVDLDPTQRLGKFVDLLLRIDQRNHPELYGNHKSRAAADPPQRGTHGVRMH